MKILIVTGDHPKNVIGGSEYQSYLIAKELLNYTKDVLFIGIDSKYNEEGNIDNLKFICFKKKSLHKYFKFYNLLKSYRPDILYVRTFYSFWWIKIIGQLLNVKVIYAIHSVTQCRFLKFKIFFELKGVREKIRYLRKYLLHNLNILFLLKHDYIICQTQEQKNLLKEKLDYRKQVSVIPNAHPVPKYEIIKCNRCLKVAWVGKYFKNPDLYIKLAEAFSDYDGINFFMIGVFPYKYKRYYEFINQKLHNFEFLGQLNIHEVNKFLENTHILIDTSDYEGFPNTFIQSWLRKVVVISLKVNPDNILTEEKIGLCSGSFEQMVKDLKFLFERRDIYNFYSQRCYDYAKKNFNISNIGKLYHNLFNEAILKQK